MTIAKQVKEASLAVYEWRRYNVGLVRSGTRLPREILALEALVTAVRDECDHDYQNRERDGLRTGYGAECVKCGKGLEHDFDPKTDRGHPVGKTCSRCGTTEWQYIDGVLCHTDWNRHA